MKIDIIYKMRCKICKNFN